MLVEKLYQLCNAEGYFTCGSCKQYTKMFDLAKGGAAAHDIALAIWLCSDNVEFEKIKKQVEDIMK